MNDLFWIGPALVFGLLAVRIGLPPLIGYLIAGFVLNLFGYVDHDLLTELGELGVTLLLFTIGLKLDVRSLLKPVVWAGATLHMLVVIVVFGIVLFWVSLSGLAVFSDVDFKIALLIAFALSFSSTVFAVKTLEEKGEMESRHGQIAIGILIMQDIFAVLFLAVSTGKIPSIWALALFGLFALRGVLMRVMGRAGHGELLVLLGLALTFGGSGLFEVAGVKGDLGALLIGALMAAHPSASEMSKKLMSIKDVLLVGFFLSIGMSGHITLSALLVALVLALAVILKVKLFFFIFTRFRLRVRSSVLASFNLANYSEFGLIVGTIAVANGWLSGDWLVIVALALTLTFIAASPLNARGPAIYAAIESRVKRFQSQTRLAEDAPIDPGDARIAIIGMGRVGTGAYDTLKERYGDVIIGVDVEPDVVNRHQDADRNVIIADATDDEFWERCQRGKVNVVLLAMPELEQNLGVARHIQPRRTDSGHLLAVAQYPEEIEALKKAGVDAAWNVYAEAGDGFALEVIARVGESVNT
ncbi:MAG: cation:proton antiporter [Gammaproteobacteria bacterium]|nr:cation:proton antiporter [Gammaproteobacteria bacterium]